jgi:hypothetical protein
MNHLSDFPGETVISSFHQVERMFQDVLTHIPYVAEHENVWSPSLGIILLEACSQLDSLWRFIVNNTPGAIVPPAGQHLNITHYHENLGQRLGSQWTVLWAQDGERIEPFSSWQSPTYVPLDWWAAYNHVKHDRLAARTEATMRCAAHALAALFINIVTYPPSLSHMARAGWVKKSVKPTSGLLLEGQPAELTFAESDLFSYLVQVDRKGYSGTRKQEAGTYGSYRFYLWIRDNMPNLDFNYG